MGKYRLEQILNILGVPLISPIFSREYPDPQPSYENPQIDELMGLVGAFRGECHRARPLSSAMNEHITLEPGFLKLLVGNIRLGKRCNLSAHETIDRIVTCIKRLPENLLTIGGLIGDELLLRTKPGKFTQADHDKLMDNLRQQEIFLNIDPRRQTMYFEGRRPPKSPEEEIFEGPEGFQEIWEDIKNNRINGDPDPNNPDYLASTSHTLGDIVTDMGNSLRSNGVDENLLDAFQKYLIEHFKPQFPHIVDCFPREPSVSPEPPAGTMSQPPNSPENPQEPPLPPQPLPPGPQLPPPVLPNIMCCGICNDSQDNGDNIDDIAEMGDDYEKYQAYVIKHCKNFGHYEPDPATGLLRRKLPNISESPAPADVTSQPTNQPISLLGKKQPSAISLPQLTQSSSSELPAIPLRKSSPSLITPPPTQASRRPLVATLPPGPPRSPLPIIVPSPSMISRPSLPSLFLPPPSEPILSTRFIELIPALLLARKTAPSILPSGLTCLSPRLSSLPWTSGLSYHPSSPWLNATRSNVAVQEGESKASGQTYSTLTNPEAYSTLSKPEARTVEVNSPWKRNHPVYLSPVDLSSCNHFIPAKPSLSSVVGGNSGSTSKLTKKYYRISKKYHRIILRTLRLFILWCARSKILRIR